MGEHEFDVVVVGVGPGGEYISTKLAAAGMAVAAVEEKLFGGECPYWSCDPSKMMIRAGNLLAEGRRIAGMAGTSAVSPDWAPVARRLKEATHDWSDNTAAGRFTALGGTLYRGHGTITGPATVRVGETLLRARRGIVIDVGTAPWVPPLEGLATTPYWTNREATQAHQVPRSLIVLGGGPAGVEFAQVFARFGATATVIEALDRLLPQGEPESSELITKVFRREGITILTGTQAQSVSYNGSTFAITLDSDRQVTAERLLVATGRKADLVSLGVAAIGQDEHADYLQVDENMQAAPGVWALGDVVGKGEYTHMSLYQGRIILSQFLGRPYHRAEYHAVPKVTFTDPEIAAVGLTETRARELLGDKVSTAVRRIPDSPRGWIHKAGNDGFIKLVADNERGVLVGATSAGPAGGEVLSMLTLAIHAHVPVRRLREMIYPYPTFHGAVPEAIGRLSPVD